MEHESSTTTVRLSRVIMSKRSGQTGAPLMGVYGWTEFLLFMMECCERKTLLRLGK